MLIALRFNLRVDYNIELPHNKAKTSTQHQAKQRLHHPSKDWIHQNIEHHLVQQVVEGCTMKFFTKICNWCPPCNNKAPIPTPDSSHSSSKVFKKFGKARMGALVS